MTAYLRLRHICLATDDLARAKRDIPDIFGVRLAFEDPHAKDFEVVNAMFPFGLGFVEAMAPMHPGAPSARFLKTTGGRGGYMLAFNCSDPQRRAAHAKTIGVRVAAESAYPGFVCAQLHPRDCRGAMIEFDRTEGEEDLNGPLYAAGGTVWHAAVKTDETLRFDEATLESPDPRDLGAHWARILERPFVTTPDGGGRIEVDMCALRFAPAPAGGREMLAAVRLLVRDPQAVRARAAALGYQTSPDGVFLCGVTFQLTRVA